MTTSRNWKSPITSAVLVCAALLLGAPAQAQSAGDVQAFMWRYCMAYQSANPNASNFCSCWVHTTLGLLYPEDTVALLRGWTTPHVPYVEQQAIARCGG